MPDTINIDFSIDEIKRYIDENKNASDSEKRFINNILEIDSLKDVLNGFEGLSFFDLLKRLDEILLGDIYVCNRSFDEKSGYFTADEINCVLKWLYIQRYINAHDEDNKEEKIKEAALQDFISDKYDSGVHFFEEILQNIDDAIGRKKRKETKARVPDKKDVVIECKETKEGEVDKKDVVIEWKDKQISFTYPDRGFSFYDLMAITSLGNSIKKGDIDQANIGEKGIGFKSVFSVAKKISIQSRFYGFDIDYDENRKASVLQPSKIIVPGSGEKCSTLTIIFNEKFSIDGEQGFKAELRKWLFENTKGNYLNFSPFLFLKNITRIYYKDGDFKEEVVIVRKDFKNHFGLTKINENYKYLIYKESLEFNKNLIENRWGKIAAIADKDDVFCIDRPAEIAFPIIDNEQKRETSIDGKKGLFYSYLPTEMDIDFPIYINVDVHLKSSRGRISDKDFSEGSEWNTHIKNKICQILSNAYIKMTELYKYNKDSVYKPIAEKLYVYINKQKTKHYFTDKLNEFYEVILKKAIFLNISNNFVKKESIWLPTIENDRDWIDFVKFCLYKPIPNQDQQYSKDYAWYKFTKGNRYVNEKWAVKVLSAYKGIKEFYEKTEIEDIKEKNRIILKVLKKAKNHSEWDDYKVLFVENESEKGYKICSKNSINGDGKVVFFHSSDNSLDNKDFISVFISKTVFGNEDYEEYCDLLKGFVNVKNWKGHIENILKTIEISDTFSLYDCVRSVSKYLVYLDSDDISKLSIPDKIKNIFCKYVISLSICEDMDVCGKNIYRKAIAKYLENDENNKFGYEIFDFEYEDLGCDKEILPKLIILLISLGIKAEPGIENDSLDLLTQSVMPSFDQIDTDPNNMTFIYPGDKDYKYLDNDEEVKLLQQYLIVFVNKKNLLKPDRILKNFESKGLNFEKIVFLPRSILDGFSVEIQTYGPLGGTTNYGIYMHQINSFRKAAQDDVECFAEKEILNLNSGGLLFADSDTYRLFAQKVGWLSKYKLSDLEYQKGHRYGGENSGIIEKIVTNAPKDMIDKLRWTDIWNEVFSVYYDCYKECCVMGVKDFISYYKYLETKRVDKLFSKAYTIRWDPLNPRFKFDINIQSTIREYICNEFDLEINEQIYEENYGVLWNEELCISLEKYKKLYNPTKFKYIIGIKEDTVTPKTDYVCMILKYIKGKNISDVQKLEIADIVEEIKPEQPKKIIGLTNEESHFSDAIFRVGDFEDLYDSMIKEAKECLPSVWKKSKLVVNKSDDWGMKEWLCEPFKIQGHVFQGYGYQCPICGSVMRHHSLSGMKYIKRIKNADADSYKDLQYLYFVSCLNCADMIERADKVKLVDFDGGSLKEILKHFNNVCYCADNFHIYNHSKLKTLKLYLEIDKHEFVEQIKISYLHMVLLLKLWKNHNDLC